MVSTARTSAVIDLCRGRMLVATLADQTSLPWPDEFPRKFEKSERQETKRDDPGRT
jgi:hypothetical protein